MHPSSPEGLRLWFSKREREGRPVFVLKHNLIFLALNKTILPTQCDLQPHLPLNARAYVCPRLVISMIVVMAVMAVWHCQKLSACWLHCWHHHTTPHHALLSSWRDADYCGGGQRTTGKTRLTISSQSQQMKYLCLE